MKYHDWSKSHNGVLSCTYNKTLELMPEIKPIIQPLFNSDEMQLKKNDYLIDVKVHMLMPGQYPCIPDWHCDFIPRDGYKKVPEKITGEEMYLWTSGAPFTEFKSFKRKIKINEFEWTVFTQRDVHRGTPSQEHTWRCFIRVMPKHFIHDITKNVGTIRRHSQVYLVSDKFSW